MPLASVSYVAFRPETLAGRLPPGALALTSEVVCSRCGASALATSQSLDATVRAAARTVAVVCDGCAGPVCAAADVVAVPRVPEMDRLIDRANAERN